MDGPRDFVEIEYLDGICARVNKADIVLLSSEQNKNERKYVHYWSPDGDAMPPDFSKMNLSKKFKSSPCNTQQEGFYYCTIIEKSPAIDPNQSDGDEIPTEDPTVFIKSEASHLDISAESNYSEDDTASSWDASNQDIGAGNFN